MTRLSTNGPVPVTGKLRNFGQTLLLSLFSLLKITDARLKSLALPIGSLRIIPIALLTNGRSRQRDVHRSMPLSTRAMERVAASRAQYRPKSKLLTPRRADESLLSAVPP